MLAYSTADSRASPTDTSPTTEASTPTAPISYGVPGPKLIREIFEGIPHNLVIKTPKYVYQKEYRIIGSRPVECRLIPDENRPGCKIEEYGHAELDLSSSPGDFTWKVSVPSLEEAQGSLMLELPHHA